jgi:GNAT superfamily N-acetyltransferase
MRYLHGPIDLSSNHRCGLLVHGFDLPPAIMMSYNPPHYRDWLEGFGLRKAKDLLGFTTHQDTYQPERIHRVGRMVIERFGITERAFYPRAFAAEIERLWQLYNDCWEHNWGFVPMTQREFRAQAQAFRPLLVPSTCRIAEVDGKPVGFALGLPDVNQAIAKIDGRLWPLGWWKLWREIPRIQHMRVITLGLLPEYRRKGIDAVLVSNLIQKGLDHGFVSAEMSWVLEDNQGMVKPLELLTGPASKVYRIFAREL